MKGRRTLLGATAALVVAPAVRAAPASADALVLARVDGLVTFLTEERAMLASLSDEDRAAAHACLRKLAREGKMTERDRRSVAVAKIPARTPEGLRAKARAATWDAGGDDTTLPRILLGAPLLTSLLADLTDIPRTSKGPRA